MSLLLVVLGVVLTVAVTGVIVYVIYVYNRFRAQRLLLRQLSRR